MISSALKPFKKGELYISYSQVNTYLLCPEKFRQSYVKGVPLSFKPADMVFGSAIHAALANYHSHLMEKRNKPSLDLLLNEFNDLFQTAQSGSIPVLWKDDDNQKHLKEQGHQLLKLYYEEQIDEVLAVEQPFSMPLTSSNETRAEEQIVGVVDLIERDADGTVYIIEIKTSGKKFDPSRLRFDRQMSLYAAAKKELGYPEAKLKFRVLVKAKIPTIQNYVVHRDEHQVKETTDLVNQVLKAIDYSIFYPLRGWTCDSCPYRSSCGE